MVAAAQMLLGQIEWGYALVGGLCTATVAVPFLVARLSVFSLWGPVTLVVTIGTGVRGLAMATRWPDPARIDAIFLRGSSFADVVWESVLALLSVLLVTAGYTWSLLNGQRTRARDLSRWDLLPMNLDLRLSYAVVAAYAAAGAVGTALYFKAVGGFSSPINDRRTVYDGTSEFQSYGHWEYLARAGTVALILFLALAMLARRRLRLLDYVVLAGLAANAFAINVITTTRTDLVYVTLALFFVVHVVRGRIPLHALVASLLVVVLGIGALSAVRAQSETSGGLAGGFSSAVLNRNGYDLSKTVTVVDAVPDPLPYAYGGTMARYLLAPAPRALWPEKPSISEGVTIGQVVYGGVNRTGIPPGLTAELVWNFGRPLAVLLSLLVGLVLGRVERASLRAPTNSWTRLAVGALVILPLGKAVMGVSIGQAASAALQTLVMLSPLFVLAWTRASRDLNRHRLDS